MEARSRSRAASQAGVTAEQLAMQRPVNIDLSFRHVLRIALRLRPAGTTVGASGAASAAIPRQVFRAGTRMPSRVLGLPALLNDLGHDLLIGGCLVEAKRR